jgi:hypothetical protein
LGCGLRCGLGRRRLRRTHQRVERGIQLGAGIEVPGHELAQIILGRTHGVRGALRGLRARVEGRLFAAWLGAFRRKRRALGRVQRTEGALGAQLVTLVRALLDLATDAAPVLLERVVALHQRLQLEALGRVPDFLFPQQPEAPIDVLAHHLGLDALDAHEVLLIESTQPLETILEL